ncbi:MAG: DeoR family transcriptional regulator [Candidatus Taylorbacteria bacterium]|nr:DeoR family transcriptional regulator [Candidatus Taylorbacteria bacterium]
MDDKKDISFIYSKSERISSALHLLSRTFHDEEPLRREMREMGLGLIKDILSLFGGVFPRLEDGISQIFSRVDGILSLCRMARVCEMMNETNFEIMFKELMAFKLKLSEAVSRGESHGFLLSSDFFGAGYPPPGALPPTKTPSAVRPALGENSLNLSHNLKQKSMPVSSIEKKEKRRETVLNLLKKMREVTVKDVAQVLSGCSEKTIQRDLLELVESGVLKKNGERRWSRYSLPL